MLDHIRLFDFINVSEWISASLPRPSPSVCPQTFPPMRTLSSEVLLKVEVERRPDQAAERHDGKLSKRI